MNVKDVRLEIGGIPVQGNFADDGFVEIRPARMTRAELSELERTWRRVEGKVRAEVEQAIEPLLGTKWDSQTLLKFEGNLRKILKAHDVERVRPRLRFDRATGMIDIAWETPELEPESATPRP
jgi:hypothetical protein